MDNRLSLLKKGIQDSINVKQQLLEDEALLALVVKVGELMSETVRRGNRVIFAGNGGSAADAQHLAAEFVSRF